MRSGLIGPKNRQQVATATKGRQITAVHTPVMGIATTFHTSLLERDGRPDDSIQRRRLAQNASPVLYVRIANGTAHDDADDQGCDNPDGTDAVDDPPHRTSVTPKSGNVTINGNETIENVSRWGSKRHHERLRCAVGTAVPVIRSEDGVCDASVRSGRSGDVSNASMPRASRTGVARRLAAETADENTFYMVKRRSRIVAPDKPTLGQVSSVGVSFVAFLVLLFLCISHGLL